MRKARRSARSAARRARHGATAALHKAGRTPKAGAGRTRTGYAAPRASSRRGGRRGWEPAPARQTPRARERPRPTSVRRRAEERRGEGRTEEHTSERQPLKRISYAVFRWKTKKAHKTEEEEKNRQT